MMDHRLISGAIEVLLAAIMFVAGCLFGVEHHPLYAIVFGACAAIFVAAGADDLHHHFHPEQ